MINKDFTKPLIFCLLCLCSSLSSYELGWTPPEIIDNTSSEVRGTVFTTYNSITNQIFATWVDPVNSNVPTYSIASYLEGVWVWSDPAVIRDPGSTDAANNVFTCFNGNTNQIIATWANTDSGSEPTYSVASYVGGIWVWSDPVSITHTSRARCDVTLCCGTQTNQLFAFWNDTHNDNFPTYSIASNIEGNWVWSDPAVIQIHEIVYLLFASYNSNTNQIFATWGDSDNSSHPTYSIASYSGGLWSWSDPAVIADTDIAISSNVTTSFNSKTNQMFALWSSADTGVPYYSIASYSGGNWLWSTPATIGLIETSVEYTIFSCYNSIDNQMFASWSDFNNNAYPTYSIASYSEGLWTWSDAAVIANTTITVNTSVCSSYNSTTNQLFSTWGNQDFNLPYFAIYTGIVPPPVPSGSNVLYDLNRLRLIYEAEVLEARATLNNAGF